jgi:hypothetical protein
VTGGNIFVHGRASSIVQIGRFQLYGGYERTGGMVRAGGCSDRSRQTFRRKQIEPCAMAEPEYLAILSCTPTKSRVAEQNWPRQDEPIRHCADTDVPLKSNKLLLVSIDFRQMDRHRLCVAKGHGVQK